MAKLYFYYAAMNAGKTTILLQSDYNYRERGMETLLFTPIIDERVQAGLIASRIGLQTTAISFDDQFDFYEYVASRKVQLPKLQCLLIDEAQFLKKLQVEQLCRIVDDLNIPALTYGLRSDFKGEPFEGSKYLLTWADNLVEIKTICHCGRKATMNLRVDPQGRAVTEGAQIEIGGNERYISLCRIHFNQTVKEDQTLQVEIQ